MSDTNCPFCNEPRIRQSHLSDRYRCGTIGPDCNGEYETGRICDETCHLRLIQQQQAEIERLRAFRDSVLMSVHEYSGRLDSSFACIDQRTWNKIKAAEKARTK